MQIVENEPSLVAFLKKLDWGVAVLADYDACRRVAYENVEDLLRARHRLCGAALQPGLYGDDPQAAPPGRGGSHR